MLKFIRGAAVTPFTETCREPRRVLFAVDDLREKPTIVNADFFCDEVVQ
jgi:hypothetical protein